jgi:hypothetical protein
MAALVQAIDRDQLRARAVPPIAAALVALGCFLGARGELGRPVAILGLVLGVLAAVVAARFPGPAACTALALVVVVPVYWAMPLPGVALAGTAAAITSVLLLPAAVAAADRIQLTLLDALVALYFLAALASIFANVDGQVAAVSDLAARSILPYAVFRVLAARDGAATALARTLVLAAVPLAVIGLREGAGHGNPFFGVVRGGFESGQWLRSQVRFGQVRAESSFGHAIAFSMFLAIALLLVLGLLWQARPAARVALAVAAPILFLALLATVSRGGLLALAVAAAVWALTLRGGRRGLVVVAAVFAAGALLTPAGDQLARLQHSVTDSTEAGDAVRYRLEIAQIVTEPGTFSLLGQKAPPGLGVVAGAKELLGLRTIDSQYALVYVTTGAVVLAAVVGIALALVAAALRRRLDPVERAWVAATAGTAVALATVALFTQMLSLFWIAVAVTAAVVSRART